MNFRPRAAAAYALSCAALLSLAAAGAAAARAQQPTTTPAPRPSATPAPAAAAAAPAATQPATQPGRAKAYAKLLEGQRHLSRARRAGGITREGLAAAQAAFRQAAELDPSLAEAHTALAELAFFFTDNHAEAEREAQLAVRVNPDNYGARRLLARLYSLRAGTDESKLKREDADRAVSALNELLRLDPNDPESLALLGEFYHLTNREPEAIDAFRRWAAAPPSLEAQFYRVVTQGGELSPAAAAARLAQSLLHAGRTAEAIASIRQALAADPENARYLQLLGQAVEQGGEVTAALDELKRLTNVYPDNAAVVGLYARTLARAGRADEGVAALRAAVAKAEGDAQLRLVDALAQVLSDALKFDEAVAAYDDLLKRRGVADALLVADADKELAADYLARIVTLQRQAGRYDSALLTVERMRRLLGPANPMADFYAATVLREQGKRREALAAVRASRLKHPENPSLLRLEATTLAELGQVEEAAALLRARLSGNFEEDYATHLTIANLYLEAGRGKEAVEVARKLVEMTPAAQPELMVQSLVMLSSAQDRAGDFKGAEESLRRILARDPNNATALNNLGYFLAERGERLPEALEMIGRAVRAEPSNGSFLDSLGWVHFKLGQLDEAEKHLSDAARRSPRSATIHEHLGDLLQKRGKTEEARAAWRKALSLSVEPAETTRLKTKLGGEANK
ncbi:MAG: tetratricopeptide repeat protein [Acidobacteria bacterium]|nr:tetratricopeptide repeat protein [Acidobacteriota bacterium]